MNKISLQLFIKNKTALTAFAGLFLVALIAPLAYFSFRAKPLPAPLAPVKTDLSVKALSENKEALAFASNARENSPIKKINSEDHVLGKPEAPVQVIVYDDFDNEFSPDYFKTIKRATEEYGEKIAVAYRHFPMRSHQNSIIAALAAECAGEQDFFWELAEKLFAAKTAGVLGEESIRAAAGELKMDIVGFEACLTGGKYSDKIQKSSIEADSINVIGAPTTFINGIPYPGALPFENFKDSSGLERKGLKEVIGEELK